MPASLTSTLRLSERRCICPSAEPKRPATVTAKAASARLISIQSGSRSTSTIPTSCRRHRSIGKTKDVHHRGHRVSLHLVPFSRLQHSTQPLVRLGTIFCLSTPHLGGK